jgi:hypothetical protein
VDDVVCGTITKSVSIYAYISDKLGVPSDSIIEMTMREEGDNMFQDETITKLSEDQMEKTCQNRNQNPNGGWLCSWQRTFLVWHYYHNAEKDETVFCEQDETIGV